MSTTAPPGAQAAPAERAQPPAGSAPDPDPARSGPAPRSAPGTDSYRLLGALSIVDGVLHAKALVDHAAHYWLFGVFFGVLTAWQTGWGMRAYRAQLSRRALVYGGIYVSVAVVAIWLVSRTVGLPIGPWAGRPESIGVIDIMASVDELVIAAMVVAIVSAAPPRGLAWLRSGYATRVVVMLATASLFATTIGGHTH
jgi:hypothetical protein